jgi:phage/plasmid-associated DNA primase
MIETEGAGILHWMIEGAVRVTVQGFNEPNSVLLSTLEYRHEEDHIAKFLDERVVAASNGSATKTAVFNAYRDWCDDNGERPITQNALNREVRSRMNVPFFLRDESRNEAFLAGAKAANLLQLKGHKTVGGMRASIYNAMPLEGVQALVAYMREFEKTQA